MRHSSYAGYVVGETYGSTSKERILAGFKQVFVDWLHVHFDDSLRGLDERPKGGPDAKARFIKSLRREADVLEIATMFKI